MKLRVVCLLVLMSLLVACVPAAKPASCPAPLEKPVVAPAVPPVTGAVTAPSQPAPPRNVSGIPSSALKADRVVTEGELVSFPDLKAVDPDGDKLTYKFSAPLNSSGMWQTKVGDAGEYKLVITVSDGKSEARKEVLLAVLPKNRPPVIEEFEGVSVKEGETVQFKPKAHDPDGDRLTLSYFGWMTSDTFTTGFKDQGEHNVTLTVSDGTVNVSKTVVVKVANVNRAPTLVQPKDVAVREGDLVRLVANAVDPDGDKLSYDFTEPLNDSGLWQTKEGDAGTYKVNVTVSDGELTDSKRFLVAVESLNHAPVIEGLNDIAVSEGALVSLEFTVSDADKGDTPKVTITGWMTSKTKQTGYQDAGVHSVTVRASDGKTETSRTITVTVKDVNRPPVFE